VNNCMRVPENSREVDELAIGHFPIRRVLS
jgi:hypothetical protein